MFLKLFWKECVQMIKSIAYAVYVVVLVLFYVTQLGTFDEAGAGSGILWRSYLQ